MRNYVLRTALILSLLLFTRTAAAQTSGPSDAVEAAGPGTVNWTTGEVFATGLGAPPAVGANPAQSRAMAERAAYVVALRNLLEAVKGVRVDAETVVENFLVKSDVIRTQVDGLVKGARVVKKQYLSDGSVEMLVAMPLKGAFLNAIVPETFGKPVPFPPGPAPQPKMPLEKKTEPVKPLPPPVPEKRAEPLRPEPVKPAPQGPEKKPEPVEPEKKAEPAKPQVPPPLQPTPLPAGKSEPTLAFKGGVATGLIIDGRGLGLRPALLPRILDHEGEELYVGQVVTRTNAVEQGVAGYAKDVNAAANNFRVTDNPAVIKGVQADGAARTDVVIAQADAGALRELGRKGDFLQHCRVIIVY